MQTLLTLLEQARSSRDEALAARSRALAAEQAGADQAGQLRAYRDDYEQRWRAQFASGGQTVQVLAHYQSFAARLTQAIELQQRQVEQLRAQRERVDALLAERERRLASTQKLIERRLADDAQRLQRHERKHDDELAARVAARSAALRAGEGELT